MRTDNPQKKEQKKGLFFTPCLCLNVFSTAAAVSLNPGCISVPVYPELIPQYTTASCLADGSEDYTLSLLKIEFLQEMTTYLQHIYYAMGVLPPFFPSIPAPDLVTLFSFWWNPKISTSTLIYCIIEEG